MDAEKIVDVSISELMKSEDSGSESQEEFSSLPVISLQSTPVSIHPSVVSVHLIPVIVGDPVVDQVISHRQCP